MTTDVLVIGSGIAGCSAALAAARAGARVTLATKATAPDECATWRAQGGIAVPRGGPDALARDVRAASDGCADPDAVRALVDGAPEAVADVLLDTLSVPFDRDGDGFDYGREAAHSARRVLHVDASTGRHVLGPFLSHLRGRERVTILEDTAALDLLARDGRVHGAWLERDGDVEACFAGATVLATGGIGALFPRSTNPDGATGDGIAMAARAGASAEDMEYVQFHPTVAGGDEPFLVSEAVRGEGALLRDGNGERFAARYHPDAELAPRDVVARAVARERERTGEVTLDVSPLDFRAAFPDLAARCAARGVEWRSGIPVAPAEHFLCGGIAVDREGRTGLDRLFAVGECARTGVHGANRLASTSLLEGLVWGLRAGEAAAGYESTRIDAPPPLDDDPPLPPAFAADKFARLRRIVGEHLGLERDPDGLRRARAALRRLKGEADAYCRTRTSRDLYELRAACVTALLVARAAGRNPESRGCHHLTAEASGRAD
ncbi:L-aspartate oxidase [Halomarina halobia]|uniref:L-aspartate oxidase n=1 Tax=Halomarina halobia TaxID=3033386 RepID=A0ABD6A764_9EURY|nr:FAD-dependent oxidoreductase [Halomarina sp. PSR21]